MRRNPWFRLLPLALIAAPLRADDPRCLLFHPTVPLGSYSGSAVLPGGPGGVVDRCTTFADGAQWQLTGATAPEPSETIQLATPTTGFGFWVGAKTELWLRFFLGDDLVHDTDWFKLLPQRRPWWEWSGTFDRVEIGGVRVLMLHAIDAGIIPVNEEESPLLVDVPPPEGAPGPDAARLIAGTPSPEQQQVIASTVPEPATLTLLASGLVGLAGAARRRKGT